MDCKIKLIHPMEPTLCRNCRFAEFVEPHARANELILVQCKRRDCDNIMTEPFVAWEPVPLPQKPEGTWRRFLRWLAGP